MNQPARGELLIISGPTAVGKGTVVREVLRIDPEIMLSVSATTRAPRPGEVDGVDYHFWSKDAFEAAIAEGQMLEYAVVHGSNYYGTPRAPIEQGLAAGKRILLEIDIQGARQVKRSMPEAKLVFIAPPDWETLVARLKGRGTESLDEQERRLATAKTELAASSEFDVILVNSVVAECANEVVNLFQN